MKKILPCILLVAASQAFATEPAAPAKLVAARSIEQVHAVYPQRELRDGREGWVVVSYVVRTDGTVRDVIVQDSSGVPAFESAALLAVKQWRFMPATLDGAPVEQAFRTAKVNFRTSPPADSARYAFVRDYRAAKKEIDAGNLDEAGARIARLEAQPSWNLYEDSWYWMLKFSYYLARGEVEPQIGCLRRAVAYEGAYLPPAMYLQAQRNLFLLEVAQAEYAAALDTYDQIAVQHDAAEVLKELAPARDQVNEIVFGSDTLARPAQVEARTAWWHKLARRDFGLDQVEGSIDGIEVRCSNQVRRFEWAPGKAWKVPPAWGDCTVLVEAKAGTRFRLLEYPGSAGPAKPAA